MVHFLCRINKTEWNVSKVKEVTTNPEYKFFFFLSLLYVFYVLSVYIICCRTLSRCQPSVVVHFIYRRIKIEWSASKVKEATTNPEYKFFLFKQPKLAIYFFTLRRFWAQHSMSTCSFSLFVYFMFLMYLVYTLFVALIVLLHEPA